MPLVLPYTFRTAGKRTPLSRLDQNFTAIATWINTRVAAVGPLASRPPAGHAGALYVAADQAYAWFLDDGATWHPVGGLGEGALTVNPATENVRLFGADAGTDGHRVLTGVLGVAPTTSPPDVAQLYVQNVQGENGRAAWTTRPETGNPRPMDPVLFRNVGDISGFTSVSGTGEQLIANWTLTGRSLEVGCRYDVASPGSARTLTFRVKLGPTTLATFAAALPILALGQGLYTCQVDGIAPTVQRTSITHTPNLPAATSTTLTTVDGALDATTDLPLVVTGQWNTSGGTMNAYMLTVRLL